MPTPITATDPEYHPPTDAFTAVDVTVWTADGKILITNPRSETYMFTPIEARHAAAEAETEFRAAGTYGSDERTLIRTIRTYANQLRNNHPTRTTHNSE